MSNSVGYTHTKFKFEINTQPNEYTKSDLKLKIKKKVNLRHKFRTVSLKQLEKVIFKNEIKQNTYGQMDDDDMSVRIGLITIPT